MDITRLLNTAPVETAKNEKMETSNWAATEQQDEDSDSDGSHQDEDEDE
jgi:hypothetical protein